MSFLTAGSSMTVVSDATTSDAIARELHRTAQPLTVLQGLLELALLTPRTPEEYRDVIEGAMEQSRRISGCFDLVRRLFHFQQPPLDLSTFSVSDMAKAVVESIRDSYAGCRVSCEFRPLADRDDAADVVTASEGRVSAALALILSALPRWTRLGGAVEVAIECNFQDVLIRIQARQLSLEGDGSSMSELGPMTAPLHLARTMVTSTGGRITQGEPGFSLLISLPRTQPNPEMYETQRIECVHV